MIENIKDMVVKLNLASVYDVTCYSLEELYYMLANKLNECISEINRFENDINNGFKGLNDNVKEELTQQSEKLEYLINQGLNDEVLKTLNKWIDDGTMDILINQTALKNVNDKIELHNNKATKLLSLKLQKLSKGEKMTVVCQGDSMTYGQDTVSTDKRPADGTLCDDTSSHSHQRAGVVYPEALKQYLDEIYPNVNHNVINKGYSGDWVERGYQRWSNNSNADIVFLMYGSNDADLNASWVPSDVRGNLEKYINDYRKLIERYLNWGTAVVLLTPTRSLGQENTKTGRIAEGFRNALTLLGKEYNIPVIDAESFSNGWDNSYYSDSTHFNSKGYKAFAGRLISTLIGNILSNDYKLYSNENISVRLTRDNLVINNGAHVGESENSYGQVEYTKGKGLVLTPSNGKCYYSFETVEDNMILIPVYGCYGKSLKFTLDFNNPQGSSTFKFDCDYAKNINNQTSFIVSDNVASINNLDKIIKKCINSNKFFHITNKGLHNICIEQTETDQQGAAFNGFIVLNTSSLKSYLSNNLIHKLTHSEWSSNLADVSQIKIYPHELVQQFGKPYLLDVNYYRYIPLKVVLLNANDSIVEYGFIWNDDGIHGKGNTSAYKQGFYKKETMFTGSGSPARNISSINYNQEERCYEVNFTGNLKFMGNITVSLI